MNSINFLPQSYLDGQRRRRRVVREVFALVMLSGLMGVAYLYVLTQTQMLQQQVLNRQADGKAVREKIAQFQNLQHLQKQLVREVNMQRELRQPLTHTAILATLGQIMPASIGLTDLTLVAHAPVPQKPVAPDTKRRTFGSKSGSAPAAPAKTSDKDGAKAKQPEIVKIKPLKVELVGLAPNDVEIADFMATLSDHDLFTEVKLLYSRSVEAGPIVGREFRIEMQVPFDRDYRPVLEPEPQEVAHASGA